MITGAKFYKLYVAKESPAELKKLLKSIRPEDELATILTLEPQYQYQKPAAFCEAFKAMAKKADKETLDEVMTILIQAL